MKLWMLLLIGFFMFCPFGHSSVDFFGGTGDGLTCGDPGDTDIYSISYWGYPQYSNTDRYYCAVCRGGVFTDDTNYATGLRFRTSGSQNRIYYYHDDSGALKGSESQIADPRNEWHHFAVTYSSAVDVNDRFDVYLDGANLEVSKPSSVGPPGDITQAITVGMPSSEVSNDRAWDGFLSDVCVWHGVKLTDEQIKRIHDSRVKGYCKNIHPNSLVLYLPLDDYPDGEEGINKTYKNASPIDDTDCTGTDVSSDNFAETVLTYP